MHLHDLCSHLPLRRLIVTILSRSSSYTQSSEMSTPAIEGQHGRDYALYILALVNFLSQANPQKMFLMLWPPGAPRKLQISMVAE